MSFAYKAERHLNRDACPAHGYVVVLQVLKHLIVHSSCRKSGSGCVRWYTMPKRCSWMLKCMAMVHFRCWRGQIRVKPVAQLRTLHTITSSIRSEGSCWHYEATLRCCHLRDVSCTVLQRPHAINIGTNRSGPSQCTFDGLRSTCRCN